MIFADYIRAVLADFEKKKGAGLLPPELLEPTPGSLRDLCHRLCDKTYSRKDEQALERFFGTAVDQKARLKSIKDFEITKFKPLINFLDKPTIQPKLKTIDLLAWLIDFKERPYDGSRKLSAEGQGGAAETGRSIRPEEAGPVGEVGDEPGGVSDSNVDPPKPGPSNSKRRKIVITITIVLAASIGFFSMWAHKDARAGMFWADDHYQVVQRDQKLSDRLVVPLDSERLIHFRKITRPDTISENALGSIWCVRYQGKYECYTDTGHHPIDTGLKLQVLTDYILMRYVNPKIGAAKISE